MRRSLTWRGFALRSLFALLLVALSYNPTGYSFSHWLLQVFPNITPLLALSFIVLTIGWAIYIRATFRSLGAVGTALAILLFVCIIWLFVDWGWLRLDNVSVTTWLVELILVLVLSIGISWSFIRRRLSGQVDVDDVDA
ncbi:DUF6524 family protein [Teredinibacter turnerae]|uniref:DUF6524 family protein n=1 Tax=Teredinibacter turnerae TaxID=2426 RepID=UPI000376F930|nr:DUF6524 family protein [Teredinibacter turnerae]